MRKKTGHSISINGFFCFFSVLFIHFSSLPIATVRIERDQHYESRLILLLLLKPQENQNVLPCVYFNCSNLCHTIDLFIFVWCTRSSVLRYDTSASCGGLLPAEHAFHLCKFPFQLISLLISSHKRPKPPTN